MKIIKIKPVSKKQDKILQTHFKNQPEEELKKDMLYGIKLALILVVTWIGAFAIGWMLAK